MRTEYLPARSPTKRVSRLISRPACPMASLQGRRNTKTVYFNAESARNFWYPAGYQ
jgi:hypothetical protein